MGINNFPKNLSIQTTSFCNGLCIFCPYNDIKDLFPRKVMGDELFKKIIDECSQYQGIERIILYLNNEPLTDPDIVDRINYAKEKVANASVHLLTNGSLLTDSLTDNLINSKLDWIGFSLHGIKKDTFEKTMGLNYELTFKKVMRFIEKAKDKRDIKEFIMVTFLGNKFLPKSEREEAVKFWNDKGIERVSHFDGPISRAGNVKDLPQVRHEKVKGCTSIWADEMIHIVENGDVVLCCMDWKREVILGNVKRQSIYEIWNSKGYNDIRDKRDGRGESDNNFICKRCESAIPQGEMKSYLRVFNKENNIDILLVTMPPWGVENPPLGLGYLESYIKHKGLKCEVCDFNIYFHNSIDSSYKMLWHVENKNYWSNDETFPLICEIFKEQIAYAVDKILSVNTDMIGFSVVDPKERLTIEIIKRIKNKARDKRIILGGPACSTEEQRIFFTDNIPGCIDCFVVGEGEETLYEIIQNDKKEDDFKESSLAGVAINLDGRWQYKPRSFINPIDTIPFPRYEGFSLNQYNGGKSLLVEWSRGCIGKCSFCKNYRLEGSYRSRSAEHIWEELKFLVEHYGINQFTVRDNIMNGDVDQLCKVCDKLIESGLDIKWSGQIAPRKEMNFDLFCKMHKAGCHKIQIGVESGSDEVLGKMRKIYTSKIVEDNIKPAKKAGMEVEIFIIVGFPGEGEKEFRDTCEFIKHNASYIDTVKSINTLHLIAGTDVYENYQKYSLKPLPRQNWHYLWETRDGNNYNVRKGRAQRLLDLAYNSRLKVMETNIKEGKERSVSGAAQTGRDGQLEKLKIDINHLQELPSQGSKMITIKNHSLLKSILLVCVFIYTLFYMIYFWVFKKLRGKALLGGD